MDSLLNSHILCHDQKNRLLKCCQERYYLLKSKFLDKDEEEFELQVTGSNLNVYTIIFKDGNFSCNCPDLYRCKKLNIYCKHVSFTICNIGKIYNENIFKNQTIDEEDLNKIKTRLRTNCSYDPSIFSEVLTEKFDYLKNVAPGSTKKFENIEEDNTRNLKDDCPICFSVLDINDKNLYKCPDCLNSVHKDCMDVWLKTKKTCVFCRSTVWSDLNISKKNSKYLNIS
jgi:hypothetical protein